MSQPAPHPVAARSLRLPKRPRLRTTRPPPLSARAGARATSASASVRRSTCSSASTSPAPQDTVSAPRRQRHPQWRGAGLRRTGWPRATSFTHSTDHPGGYSAWGENIAMGYRSAVDVFNGWMGSDGHRANILEPRVHRDGGSPTLGAGNWWCQQFGGWQRHSRMRSQQFRHAWRSS